MQKYFITALVTVLAVGSLLAISTKSKDKGSPSLLFRLISGPRSESGKLRVKDYLRQMGIGKQQCPTCQWSDEADIDALLKLGQEFYEQVSTLDRQAKELKDARWPNPQPSSFVELNRLQQQKDSFVAGLIRQLPLRLSAQGFSNLNQYVSQSMKRQIKLTPNPSSPPGGAGWSLGSPSTNRHH